MNEEQKKEGDEMTADPLKPKTSYIGSYLD